MPFAHSGPDWVEITHDRATHVIHGKGVRPVLVVAGFVELWLPEPDDLTVHVGWAEAQSAAELAAVGAAEIVENGAVPESLRTWYRIADIDGAPHRVLRDDITAEEVQQARGLALAAIKAEAGRRILVAYPAWKQANLTKRAVELIDIRQDRALTAEEDAERTALRAASAWVDAVRTASGAVEAAIPSTAEGVAGFDVQGHAGWPPEPAPAV